MYDWRSDREKQDAETGTASANEAQDRLTRLADELKRLQSNVTGLTGATRRPAPGQAPAPAVDDFDGWA